MGPTYQNMTNRTQLPEPDNRDPSDWWTHLIKKGNYNYLDEKAKAQ